MADGDSQTVMLVVLTVGLLLYTLNSVDGKNTTTLTVAAVVITALLSANEPSLLNYALQIPPSAVVTFVAAAGVVALCGVYVNKLLKRAKHNLKCLDKPLEKRPIRFESFQDADWCQLPGTFMTLILRQLDQSDVCSVRLVSKDWYNSATQCLETLKPSAFHPEYLMKDFPLLRNLDLSECVEEVTADGMVFLKFLHHLTHVSLGRHHNLIASTIDDRCLIQLTCLKKMKTLNLAQCVHITDQGLYFLAQSLPALQEVNISGCVSVTDRGVHELAQNASLRSLEMPWCLKITDMGLQALTAQPKLKHLNISGCQLITEAGISLLSHFVDLESLNLLNTGYAKVCVTDAALEKLSGLSNLSSLSIGSVHLQNTHTSDAGILTIARSFTKMKQLCLMWLDISNDAVYALSKMKTLTSLCLRGCSRVTSDALAHIAELTGLQELNLQNNPWMDTNDDVLEQLSPLREIEKLSLGDMHIGNILSDNGVAALAGFKKIQNLSMQFFEWQFAGSGLGPLLKLHQLESLDLMGSNNVSDPTLQVIGCLQNIKHLQLNKCAKISSNGLKHLTNMKLQSISMAGCCRIDDQGLLSLSEIPTLTSLNLSQCILVTDVGIAHLKKCYRLKNLDVSGCRELRGDGFEGFDVLPLSTLNVSGCAFLLDGALLHVGKISSLTKLDMCGCTSITDVGIGGLRELTNLTGVDVTGCVRLGDLSLHVLSLLPRLTTLKVNFCDLVTDYGMSHLVRLPGLLTAHFDRCQNITDQSLVHLGNCASLTSLRLARCARITDAGVAHLAKLSQLSILSLAQCPFVTDNGIRSLSPLTALASFEY